MDDERLAPAVRAVALLKQIEHRRPLGTRGYRRGVVERHGQHPGRLVDDDQRVVLEERFQTMAGPRRGAARRRSRPIDPQADDLAGGHRPRAVRGGHLGVVDEDAPARQRVGGAAARAGTIGGGEELVEPLTRIGGLDGPGAAAHALVAR